MNLANKVKNTLFSENNIFSSTITDFIKDRNNKKYNNNEENSDDEEVNDFYFKDEEKNKISNLNFFFYMLKFIFHILKYFSVAIIFTIYFIGSIKYFLLNIDIMFFEEKVRNSKIANHLEKTNYGIYKYIISLSDIFFGNYNVYGIYGNTQKEILNILGRSEIEIEYLYNDNNNTWNNIDFKYKLCKENTNPKFIFFHTPRLDFKMAEVAYNEDINEDDWMISLIGKLFQKNPVVLDLFNYNIEQKKFLRNISMFERMKEIYFGRKEKLIITNDEIDKIRIDIFKYKFKNNSSFQRKRYKEYISQIEKYAIILISEKLDLPKYNSSKDIKFNIFQFIPIIDIVIIIILIKIILYEYNKRY